MKTAKTAKTAKALRDEKTLQRFVARNAKAERKERGLSVAALARRSGLHARHIQKIEDGELNVTLATLARLSVGLEMEAVDLMRRSLARTP